MKWEGSDECELALVVAGSVLAWVSRSEGTRIWRLYGRVIEDIQRHPTREAAMQAAEQAVREWLGKAVAEVMEPVAYGLPNSSITPHHALMQVALDIPSTDQYGGALWVPLYAIAKEPKV